MGNSGWTADPYDITLPPNAGPGDPRIYIGSNDPVLDAIGQDAGIVWYFGPGRAFALTVEQSGGPDYGQLHLYGYSEFGLKQLIDFDLDVLANEGLNFIGQGGGGNNVSTYIEGLIVGLGGFGFQTDKETTDIEIYGTSGPRGFQAEASSTVDSGAITTETVVLTSASRIFTAGRAYRITTAGGLQGNTAGSYGQLRFRKTNAAGQDLGELFRYPIPAASLVYSLCGSREFVVGASSVTASICLTLAAPGGAPTVTHRAVAGTSPRYFTIEDVGAAADFPNRPTLV